MKRAICYLRETEAVSALEYAVLAGIVVVSIGAAIAGFSNSITTTLSNIGANLEATANKTGK